MQYIYRGFTRGFVDNIQFLIPTPKFTFKKEDIKYYALGFHSIKENNEVVLSFYDNEDMMKPLDYAPCGISTYSMSHSEFINAGGTIYINENGCSLAIDKSFTELFSDIGSSMIQIEKKDNVVYQYEITNGKRVE